MKMNQFGLVIMSSLVEVKQVGIGYLACKNEEDRNPETLNYALLDWMVSDS